MPEMIEAIPEFTFTDLCRMWAKRTAKAMAWAAETGSPVREYGGYRKMTAREVSVAIGWIPWPESWPVPHQAGNALVQPT
jgi:hypothetical protein